MTTVHLDETDGRSGRDPITQRDPGWRLWSTLIEATQREMQEPGWMTAVPQLKPDRPATAPLLAGAAVTLAPGVAQRWVRQLLQQAMHEPHLHAARVVAADAQRFDALTLLEAAICLDEPRLVELARRGGMDPAVLGALAHLAALPLLQACARLLAQQLPLAWPHGYCPVCGGWPTLAERRGVERTHRLRCARCGGDWGRPVLCCPYCGESDHQRLGTLMPENGGEARQVAICMTCKGYLKVLMTLQGGASDGLVRHDLETIDLDIAALDRGYKRPKPPGYALFVHVLAPPSRLRAWFGWRAASDRSENRHDSPTPR
jgi:FdhE protein